MKTLTQTCTFVLFLFFSAACSERKAVGQSDRQQTPQQSDFSPAVVVTAEIVQTENEAPVAATSDSLVVDHAYFEKHMGTPIPHSDSDYAENNIHRLQHSSMIGGDADDYVYDNMHKTFSVIGEVKLYPNLRTVLLRGDTEMTLAVWLVNYDMDGNFIDSFIVGEDEWAESASYIVSTIYLKEKPCIKQEHAHWQELEKREIRISETGKFKIIKTVRSKREM